MSVYYVLAPDLAMVKIGFAENAAKRFSKIQSDSPARLVLVAVEEGGEELEAARHGQFAALRQRGEWFRFDGSLLEHVAALGPIPAKSPSLNARLMGVGISHSYASMILSGARTPPLPLAIRIFQQTGLKFGLLVGASDQQIDVLASVPGLAA